jgi:flagellar biosynthetic protein FlhB
MPERTEPATARRRDDARRKGQVAKSGELISAVMLIVAVVFLGASGGAMLAPIMTLMRRIFGSLVLADLASGTLRGSPIDISSELANLLLGVVAGIAPFLIIMLLVAIVANLAQVGLRFTPGALTPSLGHLNPLSGFKRLLSKRGLVELGKATVKLILVGYVAYGIFTGSYAALVQVGQQDIAGGFGSVAGIATELGKSTSGWLLVLAVADVLWQRRSFDQGLRMSKQEVTDEMKQQEVPPQVKAELRKKQRHFALSRMMAAVPKADVIVTNPTHFAVALYYDPRKMSAPTVCAKGQRLIAHNIVRVARENRVPIVQNPPLARALFHTVEIGQAVPPALYRTVAEVLAFVFRLKQERANVR